MTRKKEITFPIACIGLHFYLPAFIVILRVFRIVMGCLTALFVQSMELWNDLNQDNAGWLVDTGEY